VEQLGALALELVRPTTSLLLDEPLKLTALSSACALLNSTLPEHEPCPELYVRVRGFTEALEHDPLWVVRYIALEVELLARIGYGLDLSCCAATGVSEELVYVSPKSGHAVSAAGGMAYRDRLLRLPAFLLEPPEGLCTLHPPSPSEIIDGFRLTGYFFDKYVFSAQRHAMPAARSRLVEKFQEHHA
jgi:DNA repair protein RecO (recombination protein O)